MATSVDNYIEVTSVAGAQETARELRASLDVKVRAAPKGGAGSTARELRNAVVCELRAAGMRDDELEEAASSSRTRGGAARASASRTESFRRS